MDEALRLKDLASYRIIDTPPEQEFDEIVELVAAICEVPVSLITFIDEDKNWFKAKYGTDIGETPRALSFFRHTLDQPDVQLIVPDLVADARFTDNPLVKNDPYVRFYAAAPLTTPAGNIIGTLCVMDTKPRELSPEKQKVLHVLSGKVMQMLNRRKENFTHQEEKRRQAEQLQKIADHAPGIIFQFEISPDGARSFPFVSKGIEGMRQGLTADMLMQDPELAFRSVHHDDVALLNATLLHSYRHLTDWKLDFRVMYADGTVKWHHGNAHPEKKEDGTVVWYGSFQDITDAKIAEAELAQSREEYRSLFEHGTFPMWIVTAEVFEIVDVNRTAIDHYGFSREEFLSMHLQEVLSPEDVLRLPDVEKYEVTTAAGKNFGTWQHLRKDGSVIFVEVSSSAVAYRGKSCRMVVCNDVTEKLLARRELEISNERYWHVSRATSDALWDWDLENEELFWGEGYTRLFGHPSQDTKLNYAVWESLLHPDDLPRIAEHLTRVISDSAVLTFSEEYRYRKADGTYAFVQSRAIFVRDKTGRATRMIGAMQDITKEKHRQAELVTAILDSEEKERKRLASELHDSFGQTMATIMFSLKRMRMQNKTCDFTDTMRLVEGGIKEYRNISHNLYPEDIRETPLRDLIGNKVEQLNDITSANMVLEYDCLNNDPIANPAFKKDIYRIFQELTSNAMKHAEAANIYTRIICDGHQFTLEVADDGIGFCPATMKSSTVGGIGLASLSGRAQLLGGEFVLDAAPGKGTIARLTIVLIS